MKEGEETPVREYNPKDLADKLQLLFQVVSLRRNKIILQDKDGLTVAPNFVAGLMSWGMVLDWEDALGFVKAKLPKYKSDKELETTLQKVLGSIP